MSKKLPAIKFSPRPEWQKKRLAEWLEEWNLDQMLRRNENSQPAPETGFSGAALPIAGLLPGSLLGLAVPAAFRVAASAKRMWSTETPDSVAMSKLVREFDRFVAVGQVRLLSPELTPDTDRPVFVAVFGDWDERAVLMAPFSPFSIPATPGEWLTGRTTPVLQVLEVWNARSVPNASLEESWHVDDFTHDECKNAWLVFEHAAFGKALASKLEQQVGPPLIHPDDPRRRYQDEEVALLAQFQSRAQGMQEGPEVTREDNELPDPRTMENAVGDFSEEKESFAASEKQPLPDYIGVDDMLPGFLGEAVGDHREPSKYGTLSFSFAGPETPRPIEVPTGSVVVSWPTGQTEPAHFTYRSGKWRIEIPLPLPWSEAVSLLQQKKIRIERIPLS